MRPQSNAKLLKVIVAITTACFCIVASVNLQADIPVFLDLSESIAPLVEQSKGEIERHCYDSLKDLPGRFDSSLLRNSCQKVSILNGCQSTKGEMIFHFDSRSDRDVGKPRRKVLVFALIHGDEHESGSVARRWMERLTQINSRNAWRVVPILNPDGLKLNQRMNANGVDLNRNFPSMNWDEKAHKYWARKKYDPRRNPGDKGGSEIETQCAMSHIEDFSPDFIVSLHTPYGVLDFDGPRNISKPAFSKFPWVSLGTFPGSLGRYMWVDHNVPVLTVELKDGDLLQTLEQVDRLQDITGTVALRSSKRVH